jgi:hypothetical protein
MSSATQVRPMVPVLPGISGATRTIFMSADLGPATAGSDIRAQSRLPNRCLERPMEILGRGRVNPCSSAD